MTNTQKQLIADLDALVGLTVQVVDPRGMDITAELQKKTKNPSSRPYIIEDDQGNGMAFGYNHVEKIETNTITLNPLFIRGRRRVAA